MGESQLVTDLTVTLSAVVGLLVVRCAAHRAAGSARSCRTVGTKQQVSQSGTSTGNL